MNIKTNISKKNGKIYVELDAPNYYSAPKSARERIRLEEDGIRAIANDSGYECGKAISIQVLDNKLDCVTSTSVFIDPTYIEPKRESAAPKKNRQSRSQNHRKPSSNQKKSNNKLDNS
jgi:hypothetical protein